jgi:hypothetical protein
LQLFLRTRDVDEKLRIELRDGFPEIAQGRDPRAMNRMTRTPQNAVDRLYGITRGAHHYEGNRVLLGQNALQNDASVRMRS